MNFFKSAILFLLLQFIFSIFPAKSLAIVNPLDYSNNKFGIHILDPIDLEPAKELVNSSGGDWGYVTIVIQENDRNIKKWQGVFDQMRMLHLIPIVRIASQHFENGWKKLEAVDINNWIYFLNSLNWVIKNRYVIVGNEPNHADEWGGEVNPSEYSNYFIEFSKKAAEASEDFYLLPGALDSSAPDNTKHMSEEKFLNEIVKTKPEYFDHIDGLASHSYPNPDFSGSQYDTGKGSIKSFEWELNYLKTIGIGKYYPAFITETGWTHDEAGNPLNMSSGSLSDKYIYAYENVWNDSRIVAVTPFVLNYIDKPFNLFSWKNKDGVYFSHYDAVRSIKKIKGSPYQEDNGQIIFFLAPSIASKKSFVEALILIKNTGQKIWEPNNIKINEYINGNVVYSLPINQTIIPNEKTFMRISLYIPNTEGILNGYIKLSNEYNNFGNNYQFQIFSIKSLFLVSNPIDNLKHLLIEDPINILLRDLRLKFW